MLLPTNATATGFQELRDISYQLDRLGTERWTISGFLDRTEAGIVDETWKWKFLVPGTAVAGYPSLSALTYMYRQTGTSAAASGNLILLAWVDPSVNAATTATAFFSKMNNPIYVTPYLFEVECQFRKYNGT